MLKIAFLSGYFLK